jgi:hypothetical protein
VINADNGPENNGARTQWLKRLVEFSANNKVTVQLACYPPYHSKYNPVERVFGVLENYWNGDPLLSVKHALGMARSMTYKGVHPRSTLHAGGATGVRIARKPMRAIEQALDRHTDLAKWFVRIEPDKAVTALERYKPN